MKTVLIFDGDCGFCTTTANWINRNSRVAIEIVPYQWADLSDFGITTSEAAAKVQLSHGKNIYAGHRCMSMLLQIQPNPVLKLIGRIMILPGINLISARLYDWIAENRQKLPGGTPACRIPKA